MKVLVVEDTVKLARLIASGLETEGFLVDVFNNGTKALERILAFPDTYSCIILDLSLPGKDGVEVCKEARAQGVHTPIIVVTARDAIGEKVQLLDYGADDYMTKPFAFEELVARVKAVLRRPPQRNANTATVGRLTINKDAQTVAFYDEEVPLSLKEFLLLQYLVKHQNVVVSRDELHAGAWNFSDEASSNTIDVHIKNIRAKLAKISHETIIETVRGVGYRVTA